MPGNVSQRELSLLIAANAASFNKVTSQVKSKTQQLAKTSKNTSVSAKKSFKDMSTTATGALGKMTGGLGAIGPAAGGAVGGFQAMAVGARVLNVALGPIGIIIGAIAAAVKALQSYFKGTVEGAGIFAKIMGTIKGIMTVLKDIVIDFGEKLHYAFTHPKEAIEDLWKSIKENLVNRFQGALEFFKSAFNFIKNGFAGVGLAIKGLFDEEAKAKSQEYFQAMKDSTVDLAKGFYKMKTGMELEESIEEGNKALDKLKGKIQKEIELEDRRHKLRLETIRVDNLVAENRKKIADLVLLTRDYENASNQERMDALGESLRLEEEIGAEKLRLANESLAIQRESMANSATSIEDREEEGRLAREVQNIEKENADKKRELINRQNELNASLQKYLAIGMTGVWDLSRNEVEARYKALQEFKKASKEEEDAVKKKNEIIEKSNQERFDAMADSYSQMKAFELEHQGTLKDVYKEDSRLALKAYDEKVNLAKKTFDENNKILAASIIKHEEANKKKLALEAKARGETVAFIELTEEEKNAAILQKYDELSKNKRKIDEVFVQYKKENEEELAAIEASYNEQRKDRAINTAQQIASVVGNIASTISDVFAAAEAKEVENAGKNEKRKEQIRRKYANKRKGIALAEAIIGTANAVINALQTHPFVPMGPIMASVAAGLGAVQVGIISAAKFASGGIVDNPTLAMVGEKGTEYIFNENQMDNLVKGITKVKSQQPVKVTGTVAVEGQDILIAIENATEFKNTY